MAEPKSGDKAASSPFAKPASGSGTATAQRPGGQAPSRAAAAATSKAQSAATAAAGRTVAAPRTVRLSLARIDPMSALKIAFLLSVAFGIATVVATFVLWSIVKGMGAFDAVQGFINEVARNEDFQIDELLSLPRVLAFSTVWAVLNVFLITALATLTAVLYNICAALVGGLNSTFSDE